jgi:uncharacterized repeat protein (TIGR03803 family)
MRSLRFLPALVFLFAASLTQAQEAEPLGAEGAARQFVNRFSTLHRFSNAGHWPVGGVAVDAAGNIFGTTFYGGNCPTCGVIFELVKPTAAGRPWTYRSLHNFGVGWDGFAPIAPLRIVNGVIFGTTSKGGDPVCRCGEVFKLTPSGSGYRYQVLHRFNGARGATPIGGVIVGSTGTIVGTTSSGGAHSAGVIYKITAGGVFSVLHHFSGPSQSGPRGELTFGKDGAIYGTTYRGGLYNQGTVFRVTSGGAFSTLHDFRGWFQPGPRDGANPAGRLAVGPDGTIYGTTVYEIALGTAYSLTPPRTAGGAWTYNELYVFGQAANRPRAPSGLVSDVAGNLYGASGGGGTFGGGTLYQLRRSASGVWSAPVLHHFKSEDVHGNAPSDIVLGNGVIYGGTVNGGNMTSACKHSNVEAGCGTIFSYK